MRCRGRIRRRWSRPRARRPGAPRRRWSAYCPSQRLPLCSFRRLPPLGCFAIAAAAGCLDEKDVAGLHLGLVAALQALAPAVGTDHRVAAALARLPHGKALSTADSRVVEEWLCTDNYRVSSYT